MAKLSHAIEYWSARFLQAAARKLSPSGADRLGRFLGGWMHRLMPSRRKVARLNLKRAMSDHLTDLEINRITRCVFENIGRTFIEVSRFNEDEPERLRQIVSGAGRELFEEAHRAGKGGILLTAHFGNWEILGAWVAAIGYKTNILVTIHSNLKFNELLNECRRRMGVEVVSVGESVKNIFRALQRNEFIGIAGDQHSPVGSLIIDFFGRPVAASKGPAVFSLRTGAPLLPFLLVRERYDSFRLLHDDPIFPADYTDDDEGIQSIVTRYHRFYERAIREYPDQWLWTHRRWKL